MPMKLEAWPGGRWFRDLGNNTGHFWGVVHAIKPPSLLEICGPLFMSTPAVSNIQYRLTEENGVTRLRFVHRAMGWIDEPIPALDGKTPRAACRTMAGRAKVRMLINTWPEQQGPDGSVIALPRAEMFRALGLDEVEAGD